MAVRSKQIEETALGTQRIVALFDSIGKQEQIRRERQQLDRLAVLATNARAEGRELPLADILRELDRPAEVGTGLQGFFQNLGGKFQPDPGRFAGEIKGGIVGDALRRALGQTDTPAGFDPAPVKKRRTQRDIDLATIGRKGVSRFRKNEARKRLSTNPSQPKEPFPQNFDFNEVLDADDKKDGKFGEKAYRNGLDRARDAALQGGTDPQQAEELFNQFWDARVENETTGFVGAFTRNVTLSRSEFQEGNVGRVKKDEVSEAVEKVTETGGKLDPATAQAILAEAGFDKGKAREIAKQRGFTF